MVNIIKINAATDTQKSLAKDEDIRAIGKAYNSKLNIFSKNFILTLCIIIFSLCYKKIIKGNYNTYKNT